MQEKQINKKSNLYDESLKDRKSNDFSNIIGFLKYYCNLWIDETQIKNSNEKVRSSHVDIIQTQKIQSFEIMQSQNLMLIKKI